jgi:hypothetical protein
MLQEMVGWQVAFSMHQSVLEPQAHSPAHIPDLVAQGQEEHHGIDGLTALGTQVEALQSHLVDLLSVDPQLHYLKYISTQVWYEMQTSQHFPRGNSINANDPRLPLFSHRQRGHLGTVTTGGRIVMSKEQKP